MSSTIILSASAFAGTTAKPGSVWITDGANATRLDLLSRRVVASVPASARTLVLDPDTNSVWLLDYPTLVKVDTEGNRVAEFDLGLVPQAKLLRLNPYDGSIWMAGESSLLHLSREGKTIGQWTSTDAIVALDLDFDESLWVLTDKELTHLSSSAMPSSTLDLRQQLDKPRYLALDRIGNRAIIANSRSILQFNLEDLTRPPANIVPFGRADDVAASGRASEIVALSVHPVFGTLWVTDGNTLQIYDRDGKLLNAIDAESYGIGTLTALAYDPINLSSWLAGRVAIAQVRGTGELIDRIATPNAINAFGVAPFKLAPTVTLLSPAADATNDALVPIRYALQASCTGTPCFLANDYVGSFTFEAMLNGTRIGEHFRRTATEAVWIPMNGWPEGVNELKAKATDRYGHASAPVLSRFTVAGTSRKIEANGGSKPASALATPPPSPPAAATPRVGAAKTTTTTLVPTTTSSASGVVVKSEDVSSSNRRAPDQQLAALQTFGQIPISFEANLGQAHSSVKFLARSIGHTVFLTGGETTLVLRHDKGESRTIAERIRSGWTKHAFLPNLEAQDSQSTANDAATPTVMRMKLVGARPTPEVEGLEPLATRSNYLVGDDPGKWIIDVPHYAKIKHHDVYPGVDQVFYGKDGSLEYDLIVQPGADPRHIRLSFEGASDIHVNDQGDLVLETAGGPLTHRKPFIYQDVNGARQQIAGRYVVQNRQVRIEVGDYDSRLPLVIDPSIVYSTYLGGNGNQSAAAIAVGSDGSAYVAGTVFATDFPVVNPISGQTLGGSSDVFVAKLSPDGKSLVYSTYLGGSSGDSAYGIAVDSAGSAYVVGQTSSTNFPVVSAAQSTKRTGADGFVTKLNADGNGIAYSTYLGGNGNDFAASIALDADNNAYITGQAASGFPIQNAFMSTAPSGTPAFVTKLTSAGALSYSTYLGGTTADSGYGIAVDSTGSAYVTGYTQSPDFPTVTPVAGQACPGIFVTKFSADGTSLAYSTCVGAADPDLNNTVAAIALDNQMAAYITGTTTALNFPTVNAFQATTHAYSITNFVTKIAPAGNAFAYSTYLGGGYADWAYSIAVDDSGRAYISGQTQSPDFPLVSPLMPYTGGNNAAAFIARLEPGGEALGYSSLFGGSDSGQNATDVAVDGSGNVYLVGGTRTTDFPVVNPIKATNPSGTAQAFIMKLSADTRSSTTTTLASSATNITFGQPVTFDATVTGTALTGTVSFNDDGTRLLGAAVVTAGKASFTTDSLVQGSHAVTARYDGDSANAASTSVVVTVNIDTPPVVSLTSPIDGSFVMTPATIDIAADASVAAGAVSKVDFYQGSTLIGTATSSPYGLTWENVPVGSYTLTAKATSAAGMVTTSAPVVVTVIDNPAVSVSSVTDGAAIADDRVTLSGTVQAPANSAITVNGVRGTIAANGQFVVSNVALASGANALTVTVTTIDGKTSTQTINVTSSGPAAFALNASPTQGVTPLTVTLTLANRSNTSYGRADVSCFGNNTVDRSIAAPTTALGTCVYTASGIYNAQAKIYDTQNQLIATLTQPIVVGSLNALDAMLRATYSNMLTKLKAGDVAGALNYVTAAVYNKYNAVFTTLGPSLSTIADQVKNIQTGAISDQVTDYVIVRNGKVFLISFILGDDGIWRVDAM